MRDKRRMVEAKWVRVMRDIFADGLWGPDGAGENADDLPVTDELRERLRAWQDVYDKFDSGPDGSAYLDDPAFSEEGRRIAQAIKKQLPDWTVIYFDELAASKAAHGAPRTTFEYEIEL